MGAVATYGVPPEILRLSIGNGAVGVQGGHDDAGFVLCAFGDETPLATSFGMDGFDERMKLRNMALKALTSSGP
jgi:hypothetical protein